MKSLSCARCDSPLENFNDSTDASRNQPLRGCEFVARGHYGSSVWDPMDGRKALINICDPCLIYLFEKQFVRILK